MNELALRWEQNPNGYYGERIPEFEKISIDYAVMEKAKDNCHRGRFQVDDIGSWYAIERWNKKDSLGNTILGIHHGTDTHSCIIVNNEQHLITTIGISDLIIVLKKMLHLYVTKMPNK